MRPATAVTIAGKASIERRGTVELASAMVADDDAVDPLGHGATGLVRVQHALEQQRPAPHAAQPGDVRP